MIRAVLQKLIYRERSSSEAYINYLKKLGVRIGEETHFYGPRDSNVDETRPYLVEIGRNVHLAPRVVILTHDYGWTVLRDVYHEMVGSGDKVTIEDNVFVGLRTTILKGVTIGENSIIGANSLVTKDIPPNSVAAGVPAKVICTIDEYWNRRKNERVKEAKITAIEYYKVNGDFPPVEEMFEFFWIFEKRVQGKEPGYSHPSFHAMLKKRNIYPKLKERYNQTTAYFSGYSEFIRSCKEEL